MPTLYSLPVGNLREYQKSIATGYSFELVDVGFQKYLIIPIKGKEYAAIAWPLVTDNVVIWGIPKDGDILFETSRELQAIVLPLIHKLGNINVLVFPRYE